MRVAGAVMKGNSGLAVVEMLLAKKGTGEVHHAQRVPATHRPETCASVRRSLSATIDCPARFTPSFTVPLDSTLTGRSLRGLITLLATATAERERRGEKQDALKYDIVELLFFSKARPQSGASTTTPLSTAELASEPFSSKDVPLKEKRRLPSASAGASLTPPHPGARHSC